MIYYNHLFVYGRDGSPAPDILNFIKESVPDYVDTIDYVEDFTELEGGNMSYLISLEKNIFEWDEKDKWFWLDVISRKYPNFKFIIYVSRDDFPPSEKYYIINGEEMGGFSKIIYPSFDEKELEPIIHDG